ncbi:MAG: ATP-binding cassette domain-containing protein [Planctomycetota bacterium]|nr:ATP-binding cassette domain-containing protein [Planctomycetota bacterium]
MIEIQQLTKVFDTRPAVDQVTFTVRPGEVLGFLGPNGAGKSTTMKMLTGFLPPTSGGARICGHEVTEDPIAAQRCIGYLPEGAPLYPDMTPASLLQFVSQARSMERAHARQRTDEVVALVGIESVMKQRIDTLSKGFKRRVGLAAAILHDPQVLILDEPTDGLDPNQKEEVRKLIRSMAQDKVIVLSTHILEEVEAVCTRAIIISEGRVLFDGTPAELRARSTTHGAVALHLAGTQADAASKALNGLAEVERVEVLAGDPDEDLVRLRAYGAGEAPLLQPITDLARNKNWDVRHLSVERGSLDEVFRTITTQTGAQK